MFKGSDSSLTDIFLVTCFVPFSVFLPVFYWVEKMGYAALTVTCGIVRAKCNIPRLRFPKTSWRSLCLSFSLQRLYWVTLGMWKAIWENLSGCEKISGFEILWTTLANAHSIFQGVWLPSLLVRVWHTPWNIRACFVTSATELINKATELGKSQREEIPLGHKL